MKYIAADSSNQYLRFSPRLYHSFSSGSNRSHVIEVMTVFHPGSFSLTEGESMTMGLEILVDRKNLLLGGVCLLGRERTAKSLPVLEVSLNTTFCAQIDNTH